MNNLLDNFNCFLKSRNNYKRPKINDVGFCFLSIIVFTFILYDVSFSSNLKRRIKNGNFKRNWPKAAKVVDCDFSYTNFNYSDFEGKEFVNFANFSHCVFNDLANFELISLNKGISFHGSIFNENFTIYRLGVSNNINFDSTVFKKQADFERVSFDSTVNFSFCRFENKANFKDMYFNKADFSNMDFTPNTIISFHNTSAKILDFSFNPKIYNEIRLIDAFGPIPVQSNSSNVRCLINLYKSDISKFYLDYNNFKLYFPNYRDNSDNSDSTEINTDEKKVIYEALLNNFKSHGQADSYQLLDIEYQIFKYDLDKKYFYKWLSMYWWNFGYSKEYIFIWTFGLLLFFTLINTFILNYLNKNIYKVEQIRPMSKLSPSLSFSLLIKNCGVIIERFWYSIIYTSVIFLKLSLKVENFQFKRVLGTIYIFFIYLTGLVCIAYMANFILQK